MKLTLNPILSCLILMVYVEVSYSYNNEDRRMCTSHDGCLHYQVCKEGFCVCKQPCDGHMKLWEHPCFNDRDCAALDINLACLGNAEYRACRCRRTHLWDPNYNRCVAKGDDPVQTFIIPAIIVMSVGAMAYLGIKLFCNCGKLWRRRRSDLSRELDNMSATPHQQAAWVASYRVFSPLNNTNRPPLHATPCMGLFVPSQTITRSPPPYEEALKHKVILSSYHPTAAEPPQLPLYSYAPQPAVHETTIPVIIAGHGGRIPPSNDTDQIRPLRYYPGEDNPQIPAVWSSIRPHDRASGYAREVGRATPLSALRSTRSLARSHRSHRRASPDRFRDSVSMSTD